MPPPAIQHSVAGLFAGVGGIELGLSRSGHHCDLLCEFEPGAKAVLNHRFPGIELHDDVCALSELPGEVTLLAGGFPCQDLSQAGNTKGISGERSGLVGQVFRLLRQRRVPWVLLENVPFMLQLNRGEALEVILREIEALGYSWAYRVVDSRAFGLPQRRQRVYLLASLEADPRDVLLVDDAGQVREPPKERWREYACGFYWTEGLRGLGWATDAVPTLKGGSTIGIPSPPAVMLKSGRVVKPHINDAERMQGFPVDWTIASEKVMKPGHRWKLVGNAVSVNAAQWLGERLAKPGTYRGDDPALQRNGRWPMSAYNVGDGRRVSPVSTWPMRVEREALEAFLQSEPTPLSVRATSGFLSRTGRARLRFPPDFLHVVEQHLRWAEANLWAGGDTD